MSTNVEIIDNLPQNEIELNLGDWIMYEDELCIIASDSTYNYVAVNINTGEIEQSGQWLSNIDFDSIVNKVEIKIS